MRITKVKIDKKNVSIHRTSDGAKLIYNNNSRNSKTDEILPRKKLINFRNSLIGKIIIKKDKVQKDGGESRRRKQAVKNILSDALNGRYRAEPNLDTQKCIRSQYAEFKFNGQTYNLTELIHEGKLEIFKQWADDNINKRCEHLKKSIRNNKISLADDPNPSKRKITLTKLAAIGEGELNPKIKEIENIFQIDSLRAKLTDIDQIEDVTKPFEYHCKIKKALQAHQASIFGSSANPNITNRINSDLVVYSQEVVKYLHKYFPLKATGRKNDREQQKHYIEKIADGIACQIKNGINTYQINSGKQICHEFNNCVDTEQLLKIRAEEAFASNLLDSTAFAAHNINLIMGNKMIEDILGKKSFNSNIVNVKPEIFDLFFNNNKQEGLSENNLWAMRGAVQGIRNKLVDYNKNALSSCFDIKEFETFSVKGNDYSNLFYKSLLENEIKDLNSKIAERLKSSGVLGYYDLSTLQEFLSEVHFPLCRSVVPFAPSYKKVFSRGCNIQKSKDNKAIEVSNFFHKTAEEVNEKYQARYYIIKLIYENLFLNSFTKDENAFRAAVTKLLSKNNKANNRAFAFAEIRDFSANEDITSYMAYLQSELHEEVIRKENSEEKRDRINFEKFILDLFVVGFDNYINRLNLKFIHTPKSIFDECERVSSDISIDAQTRANELNKRKDLIAEHIKLSNHSIDPQTPSHISFYVFCKLLSSSYLGSLRNELLKYRSFTKDDFKFDYILSIIELCLLSSDIVSTRAVNYVKDIMPFFAKDFKLEDCGELYYQSENTPVVHSGIELAKKYGTLDKLKMINSEKIHITEDDYRDWKERKTNISTLTLNREKLHEDWIKNIFIEKKKYIEICNEIDNYNWLDNKLHLIHINRLHNLLIDILARMVGYVAKRDRDIVFLKKYFKKEKLSQKKSLEAIIDEYDLRRKYIAHFMYLFKDNKSLIDMINDLRDVMSYDRKLKNAVAKSIIKIFDKHQMVLKLEFTKDDHKLIVESVKPKKIYHLVSKKTNRESFFTYSVHQDFCDMCQKLLEIKK